MKRPEVNRNVKRDVKRKDLARALAERSRGTSEQLTEGQAQDELDRVVHAIVTRLRRGRSAEMPGIGTIAASAVEQDPGTSLKVSKKKTAGAANTERGN